jgi:hypothetical protein
MDWENAKRNLDGWSSSTAREQPREVELRGLDGFTKRMKIAGCPYEVRLPMVERRPFSINPESIPGPEAWHRTFRRRSDLDAGGIPVYVEAR